MNTVPPPAKGVDWGAIGLVSLGLVCAWLAYSGLAPTFGAIAAGAPIVSFSPYDLIPVPLMVSCLALAAIALIPRKGGAGRGDDKAFWRAATRLFYLAGAGAIVAIAIAPAGRAVVSGMLADRGYVRCPPAAEPGRRAPLRWHLPDAACP